MMKIDRLQKRYYGLSLLMGILLITGACAGSGVINKPYTPDRALHYTKLQDLSETKNLNGHIFYMNAGDSIPLKITMQTDFMEFKQDRIDLVAKQKLYFMIKMPDDLSAAELTRFNQLDSSDFSKISADEQARFVKDYMLYVSADAVHWAPLSDGKACREVLGYKSGSLSLGMMANVKEGLGASVAIRTFK